MNAVGEPRPERQEDLEAGAWVRRNRVALERVRLRTADRACPACYGEGHFDDILCPCVGGRLGRRPASGWVLGPGGRLGGEE